MASRDDRKKEFDECLKSLRVTTKIVTRHKLENIRRILTGDIKSDPKLKFWVKKRNFRIIDLPKLGLKKVVVVPLEGEYGLERTMFGRYKKVVPLEEVYSILESVHSNSLQHFGHKRTLYEAQRHYYGITRSAVDKFIKDCPICKGKENELDGLLGPRRRSAFESDGLQGPNFKKFKVGDVVVLVIPAEYKEGLDVETLPCIVTSARSRAKALYQLCCEYGIISCWFGEEHLKPYGGIVTMDISREITIYEAARILHAVSNMTCQCEDKKNCTCAKIVADTIYNDEMRADETVVESKPFVKMDKFGEEELKERYNSGLCAAQYCQEPSEDVTVECSACSCRYHTFCLSSTLLDIEGGCYCGCNSQEMIKIKVHPNQIQEAEEYLKSIVNGVTPSWRVRWWQSEEKAGELRKHSHVSCLEGGSHDQIMNYFLGKDFVKEAVESTVLRVAFILDVILPEAVIYFIQQKQNVSRCFAEKMYSKQLPAFNQS